MGGTASCDACRCLLEWMHCARRTRHKPKMSVTLVKSAQFDDIVAAESAGREGRDSGGNAPGSGSEDGSGGLTSLVGPRHYVGGGGPGSRRASRLNWSARAMGSFSTAASVPRIL